MSASEIDEVRALLSSKPRPTSLAERRARLDEVASVDPIASDIRFQAARIGACDAEWSTAPGAAPDAALLFLHGGGYSSGSIVSHRRLAAEAGRSAGVRTLALGYRLAPEHPFPAALDDALCAYDYLIAEGIPPSRVVIGGDSAGGGLTLACLVSLRDRGEPTPAGAWLLSPWVDLAMTGASMETKAAIDPLIHRAYLDELARNYVGDGDRTRPLVSPLHADVSGLPPTLIQVGSAETLIDDAVRIAGRLGEADVRTTLEIWPHMIHAWPLWAMRVAEGREAIASAGRFIAANLGR